MKVDISSLLRIVLKLTFFTNLSNSIIHSPYDEPKTSDAHRAFIRLNFSPKTFCGCNRESFDRNHGLQRSRTGFTIVELLVVIVVIGILAAITIVSYTGISNKASIASLQSDLSNVKTQLALYQIDNSAYPNSITNCPTPTTGNLCLKVSNGNSLNSSYTVNNTTSPQTYSLTLTNSSSNTFGVLTNDSKPIIPVNTTAPLSPVADWLAIPTGNHYGNFYDSVTKQYATVTRTTPKTIYDPSTQHIYDVPAGSLAVNPRSDGKSGYEAVIEEGRTNLIKNSYFKTDLTGWSYSNDTGGSGTGTRSTDKAVYGSASAKITKSGNFYGGSWLEPNDPSAIPVTSGQTYIFSAYVYIGNNGIAKLFLYDTQWNSVTLSAGSGWQRLTMTRTVTASQVLLRLQNDGNNSDVWFDAVQLELNPWSYPSAVSSYIPTFATTITRDAEIVTIPTLTWNKSSGTLLLVGIANITLKYPQAFGWYQNYNNQLSLGAQNNSRIWFWAGKPDGVALNYAYGNEKESSAVYAGTWNNGAIPALFIDGSKSFATQNYQTMSGLPSTAYIGSAGYGAGQWNSSISRVTVYSSAISDIDITNVTNAIKDGP